jgi:hypothetical protein
MNNSLSVLSLRSNLDLVYLVHFLHECLGQAKGKTSKTGPRLMLSSRHRYLTRPSWCSRHRRMCPESRSTRPFFDEAYISPLNLLLLIIERGHECYPLRAHRSLRGLLQQRSGGLRSSKRLTATARAVSAQDESLRVGLFFAVAEVLRIVSMRHRLRRRQLQQLRRL